MLDPLPFITLESLSTLFKCLIYIYNMLFLFHSLHGLLGWILRLHNILQANDLGRGQRLVLSGLRMHPLLNPGVTPPLQLDIIGQVLPISLSDGRI